MFTNQYPYGNLKNPTRGYKPPIPYTATNFFTIYTTTNFRTIVANKAALYNRTPATDDNSCNVQGKIYTYRTLDSRVKNISPTWDQISDTEFYKFKPDSDIWIFYDDVITILQQTKQDIADKIATLSGTTTQTGMIPSLSQLKNKIATQNTNMQNIIAYNHNMLS